MTRFEAFRALEILKMEKFSLSNTFFEAKKVGKSGYTIIIKN
jgi:hypothetical protein